MKKDSAPHAHHDNKTTVITSDEDLLDANRDDTAKETYTNKEIHEDISSHTPHEEIHTKSYTERVANGESVETAGEPKKSFWTSDKFQWMMFGLGLLIIGGIYLFSTITSKPIAVNPTNMAITFQINGKEFTIPANRHEMQIDISHGENTLTMSGKEIGKFNYGWFDGKSIVNPMMVPFVLEEVIYTVKGNPEAFKDKVTTRTIEINGEKYEGPFEYIKPTLYLKKNWDYAPWEASADTVHTKSNKEYAIRKELYYIDDFVKSFESPTESTPTSTGTTPQVPNEVHINPSDVPTSSVMPEELRNAQ